MYVCILICKLLCLLTKIMNVLNLRLNKKILWIGCIFKFYQNVSKFHSNQQ